MAKKVVIFLIVIQALTVSYFFFYKLPRLKKVDVNGSFTEIVIPERKYLNDEEAKKTITVDECKDILNYLASDELEGRMSGKKGNILAMNYIKEDFHKNGLKTFLQKFRIRRLNNGPKNETGDDFTQNVIGVLEGKKKECIVIGAHYDHIGYGPSMTRDNKIGIHNGADDNGSGVVALLELAEAFSKVDKTNYTFVFIAFSGEEMGLIGSTYYVANPVVKDTMTFMVNFDMIGWYKNKKMLILGGSRIPRIKNIVDFLSPKYQNLKVELTSQTGGGSDHVPFVNKSIPSVFVHTGSTPVYHTTEDDVDKIDFEGLNSIIQFSFDMIYRLDKSEEKINNFEEVYSHELPYTHDHDIMPFPLER